LNNTHKSTNNINYYYYYTTTYYYYDDDDDEDGSHLQLSLSCRVDDDRVDGFSEKEEEKGSLSLTIAPHHPSIHLSTHPSIHLHPIFISR